jgi:hypothetical protein
MAYKLNSETRVKENKKKRGRKEIYNRAGDNTNKGKKGFLNTKAFFNVNETESVANI